MSHLRASCGCDLNYDSNGYIASISSTDCQLPALVAALQEIAKGAGPYSPDRLEHAENTVQEMKALAKAALGRVTS